MFDKKTPKPINFTLPILLLMGIMVLFGIKILMNKTSFAPSNNEKKMVEQYQEQQMMEEKGIIKVGDRYLQYGVKEQGEIKPITDMLEHDCSNDYCKIKRYYTYVKRLPYESGTKNKDKNAIDVIMSGKGDCDERSYLFASMLVQNISTIISLILYNHIDQYGG